MYFSMKITNILLYFVIYNFTGNAVKKKYGSRYSNECYEENPIPIPNITILLSFHKKKNRYKHLFSTRLQQLLLNKHVLKVNNKKNVKKCNVP